MTLINNYTIRKMADVHEYWFDITDAIRKIFGKCVSKAEICMFTVSAKFAKTEANILLGVYDEIVTDIKQKAQNFGKFNAAAKQVEISFHDNKPVVLRGTTWDAK